MDINWDIRVSPAKVMFASCREQSQEESNNFPFPSRTAVTARCPTIVSATLLTAPPRAVAARVRVLSRTTQPINSSLPEPWVSPIHYRDEERLSQSSMPPQDYAGAAVNGLIVGGLDLYTPARCVQRTHGEA
jgi:hypothetical protein